jgi:hypothetical protein
MHAESQPLGRFEVEKLETEDGVVSPADYGVGDESFVVRVERKFDADHFTGEKVSLGTDAEACLAQVVAVAAELEIAVSASDADDAGLRVSIAQGLPTAGNFAHGAPIHDLAIYEDTIWLGTELGWANCHQSQCGGVARRGQGRSLTE